MERLARLLPFRQFGRLRHLRGIASCAARAAQASAAALNGSLFDDLPGQDVAARAAHPAARCAVRPVVGPAAAAPQPVREARPALPSAQPAFARVSLNSALNSEAARRAPVRVYHGPSRLIMVGTVDAVCRMIDRCIAEQHADLPAALAK